MRQDLLCFLYLYLVLGAVFAGGLVYAWRQGDVGLRDRRARRSLGILVGGYFFYMGLHGFFQFIASGW